MGTRSQMVQSRRFGKLQFRVTCLLPDPKRGAELAEAPGKLEIPLEAVGKLEGAPDCRGMEPCPEGMEGAFGGTLGGVGLKGESAGEQGAPALCAGASAACPASHHKSFISGCQC